MKSSPLGIDQASDSAGEPRPRTQAEKVYRQLRADIVSGRIAPGARLRADEMQQTYAVGISPLRESLFRLSSEGLVVASEQKGFRVAPLDAEDVRDTMETRLLIETRALEQAIDHGDIAWEAAIIAAYHKLASVKSRSSEIEAETWTRYHRDFHMSLIAACRSRWMIHLARQLFDQAERHRMIATRYYKDFPTIRNAAAEHEHLLEATLARKKAAAVEILTAHYRETTKHVLKRIETQLRA